jgi:hypothetical protein
VLGRSLLCSSLVTLSASCSLIVQPDRTCASLVCPEGMVCHPAKGRCVAVEPPVLSGATAPAPAQGCIAVRYTLSQAEGLDSDLSVEWAIDGGAFLPATTAPAGDGLGPLSSSPEGTSHLFVWDSTADLGFGREDALLRLRPGSHGYLGEPLVLPPVKVDNVSAPFTAPTGFSISGPGGGLAIADVNLDGRLDMVASHNAPGIPRTLTVSVFLGDDTGSFGAPTTYDAGVYQSGVVVADFDGNSLPDIATACWTTHQVYLLLATAPGVFAPAIQIPVDSYPYDLVAVDVNHDQVMDLVVANSPGMVVLVGRGDGTFADPVATALGYGCFSITAGNLNLDDDVDVAVSCRGTDQVKLLLGSDGATFRVHATLAANAPLDSAFGDLDGDGLPDVAITSPTQTSANDSPADNRVRVFFAKDNFSQAPRVFQVAYQPHSVELADFNNDAKLDLAINAGGDISFIPGDGAGNFGAEQRFSAGTTTLRDMVGTDLNKDGKLDLVVAGYKYTVLMNLGSSACGAKP